MSKRDTLQKIMNVGAGLAGAYFVGIAIAGAIKRRREQKAVGKVERVKRRIYKEVSMAQQAGVDFSKKFPELTTQERQALERVGHDVGWKQSKRSIESGKPYVESYYGSLRRAWNAVSGISGIGATAYDVHDRDGNVVLTWTDVTDHIEHEPEAKVLLALPPHVEQKKKKAKRAPKAPKVVRTTDFEALAKDERRQFALDLYDKWINADGYDRTAERHQLEYIPKKELGGDDKTPIINAIADSFADGKLFIKINASKYSFDTYLYGKKQTMDRGATYIEAFIKLLLYAWDHRETVDQFANAPEINDVRRALLDQAQHMQITVPYDKRDDYRDLMDEDGEIRGNNRYKALELINYIVFVHQHYDVGGDVYYPLRAFETEEQALRWYDRKGHGFKVIPVWDVPIEKITGLN